MGNLDYFIRRVKTASFSRMYRNAKVVNNETHIPTLVVLIDMSFCALLHNIGYLDYRIFGFAGKSLKDRRTYFTYNMNNYVNNMFANNQSFHMLKNKLDFNEEYKDYIGRDFFNPAKKSKEEFASFLKNKDMIFIKPSGSFGGLGIYKRVEVSTINIDEFYNYLLENKLFAEDCIKQHPQMEMLHPGSINTLRVVTLLGKDGQAHYLYSILRMGKGDMSVDNSSSGGLNTCLDENGTIPVACFCDKTCQYYTVHPTSGVQLTGFKVPFFKEAIDLAIKAANYHLDLGYVGWDIAITQKGPIIVEANQTPAYDMVQNHGTSGKNTGIKKQFEDILGIKL